MLSSESMTKSAYLPSAVCDIGGNSSHDNFARHLRFHGHKTPRPTRTKPNSAALPLCFRPLSQFQVSLLLVILPSVQSCTSHTYLTESRNCLLSHLPVLVTNSSTPRFQLMHDKRGRRAEKVRRAFSQRKAEVTSPQLAQS